MSTTPDGRMDRRAVKHPLEREAAAMLYQAGWSVGELSMTFQCSDNAVRRLLADEGVSVQ